MGTTQEAVDRSNRRGGEGAGVVLLGGYIKGDRDDREYRIKYLEV